MSEARLEWSREGRSWPHREASRFVSVAGVRWHVQSFDGPSAPSPGLLLLHGTGASSHSWRDLIAPLRQHFALRVVDLPGHGFSSAPEGGLSAPTFSLPGMAAALRALLEEMDFAPQGLVGHSAGAALAVQLGLDGLPSVRRVLGINAALLPLPGLPGLVFAPAARLMAALPFSARLFAWRARDARVMKALLESTGSRLDPEGARYYSVLAGNAGHAAGALGMMAQWDLERFSRRLGDLRVPLDLLVGTRDRTVPPTQAAEVLSRLAKGLPARCRRLEGLGHLAHEEQPQEVARWIVEGMREV